MECACNYGRMNNEITPSDARSALRAAESAAARTRRPARWMATYTAVFGAAFAANTLLLGLTNLSTHTPAVLPTMLIGFMAVMGIWAHRQRALLAGTRRRVVPYWIASGLLYGAALVVGVNRFKGEPAYWIPAAIVVGLPMVVGAWRESRA
jgi:hypothetical protein